MFKVGLLLLVGLLAGCASAPPDDRYLTKEEDAQLRERCEPQGGCVAIPVPLFEQIMRALKGQRSA